MWLEQAGSGLHRACSHESPGHRFHGDHRAIRDQLRVWEAGRADTNLEEAGRPDQVGSNNSGTPLPP